MAPPARQTKSPGWAVTTRPLFWVDMGKTSWTKKRAGLFGGLREHGSTRGERIGAGEDRAVEQRARRAQQPGARDDRRIRRAADFEPHGEFAGRMLDRNELGRALGQAC